MPDYIHFLLKLPPNYTPYPKHIGEIKVIFTQSLRGQGTLAQNISFSGRQHRESDVWYRRFWGDPICKQDDFERHLNYIDYNPAKYSLSYCPHLWYYFSFSFWLKKMFIQLIGAAVVLAESQKYPILMPFPID